MYTYLIHPKFNCHMKRLSTYSWWYVLYGCLIAVSLWTLEACQEAPAGQSQDGVPALLTSQVPGVPSLLNRHASVGSDEEKTYMQNAYVKLRNAIAADANNIEARLKMTQLFMLEARATGEHGHYYPAALEMIEQVIQRNPAKEDRFYALSLKAGVLLSLHQFDKAYEVAKTASALNPYNAQILGAMVDAQVELGNYEEAVKLADKMVSMRPDLRSYSRVSYLRELHGQVPEAEQAMEMAVKAGVPGYEETAWARLTLGDLFRTYGKLDAATAQYRKILSERENYPFAFAGLASVAMAQEDYSEAERLLKKGIEIIPEVGFYVQLADLYQKTGREKLANETAGEILAMLADDEAAGHKMGLEYARTHLSLLDDTDQALAYAMEEYEMRPENLAVNQLLGLIHYRKGDLAQARRHLDKALRTGSRDPELLALAGLVTLAEGQQERAGHFLAQAKELDPFGQHALGEDLVALNK